MKSNSWKILAFYYPIIIVCFLFSSNLFPQDVKNKEAHRLLVLFEEGMSTGAVDKFSNYFSSRNYLSFSNGTASYYSANQSYYVIKDFLSIYHPISFKLTNIVTETDNPFASGNLKYNNKGIRGNATVFITLKLVDNQWRITQITIN